ncbi:MAG: SixA phosphatase family protein [Gammaproteobacteria bacterium]
MKRELLLLRHGKSDWDSGVEDFHRPLKKRGRLAAQCIGLWLQEQHLSPDCILSSPAERALSTAKKICKQLRFDSQNIVQDGRIYLASCEQLLSVLQETPFTIQRLLLVGHNPGLEDLLRYLVQSALPAFADDKLLPTATLARLSFSGSWEDMEAHCAIPLAIVRPYALLKNKADLNDYSIEYRYPVTVGD